MFGTRDPFDYDAGGNNGLFFLVGLVVVVMYLVN